MSAEIQVSGVLESVGKVLTGMGAEVRTERGLVIIPGLSTEQIREIAPLLFCEVTVIIKERAS